MSTDNWYLGIDIGGQSFKMLACRENIEVHSEFQNGPTGKNNLDQIFLAMRDCLENLKNNGFTGKPVKIGVGFPGIVAPSGLIRECPNLPHWKGRNLKVELEELLGAPVEIENDANCAALAEAVALKDQLDGVTVFLAFGTGVGGGILIDGKIHTGLQGFGGELGHMTIDRKGRMCGCGAKGCLEQYFSTNGITNTAENSNLFPKVPTIKELFESSLNGEQPAKNIVDKSIEHLAIGMANLCKILDPNRFILGGGLTQDRSGEYIIERLHEYLPQKVVFQAYETPDISISKYQGKAGVLGTLALAQS